MINKVEDKKFSGELGVFQDLLSTCDRRLLSRKIVEIAISERFHLNHPINNTPTICRSSKRIGMTNVLAFSCEGGRNRWAVIQLTNFIDAIYVDGLLFRIKKAIDVNVCLNAVKKIESNEVKLKYTSNKKVDGFIFSQLRPFHYFYDQYVNIFEFLAIDSCMSSRFYTDRSCYFDGPPSDVVFKDASKNGCYIMGSTCANQIETNHALSMHKFLKSSVPKKPIDTDLTIWMGVTGQKRVWLEQEVGYAEIINKISQNFIDVTVIVDGWTSFVNTEVSNAEDNAVYRNIVANTTAPNVEFVNLIGKDYREKISYGNSIDIFIANAGTGCMVPAMFCNKAGVLHANKSLNTFKLENDERIRIVPDMYIREEVSDDASVMNVNYSIEWQVLYNLMVELLNESGMEVSTIPGWQGVEKNKVIFGKLKFTSSMQSADILREVAVAFESAGDIRTAERIMKQALLQRPSGPFIQRKYKQYCHKLANV